MFKNVWLFSISVILISTFTIAQNAEIKRYIAVTFDDLPMDLCSRS